MWFVFFLEMVEFQLQEEVGEYEEKVLHRVR